MHKGATELGSGGKGRGRGKEKLNTFNFSLKLGSTIYPYAIFILFFFFSCFLFLSKNCIWRRKKCSGQENGVIKRRDLFLWENLVSGEGMSFANVHIRSTSYRIVYQLDMEFLT